MGNEDLGVHYREIGDLDKAYEAFGRMRNDMQSQKSLMDTTLRIISVAIDQERWLIVESNVQKLTVQSFSPEDELALQPYLKCASGLASLAEGKFNNAARSFLAVDSGRGQAVNEIVSANDIAVYGGLCALATMDRNDLQTKVLDNSNFRTYLELEPHIRRAIQQFVGGRYSACLSTLENYRADYLLDIYLHKRVTALYQLIRSKSIIQYFIPFSCVTLDSMDEAFGGSGRSIEKELIGMIESGVLEARIDKQNRVSASPRCPNSQANDSLQLLTSVPSLPRAALQAQTLESAENYEREMRNRILRMNILGAGLEAKPQKKAQHPLSSMSMAQGDGPNTRSRGREASPLSVEHDSGYD
jgi:COP9 signalosome complex subunit 1